MIITKTGYSEVQMKKFKTLRIGMLFLVFLSAGLMTSFAAEEKDYRIYDAWWQEEADGGLTSKTTASASEHRKVIKI